VKIAVLWPLMQYNSKCRMLGKISCLQGRRQISQLCKN